MNFTPQRGRVFQEKQNIIYTSVTLYLPPFKKKLINMLGDLVSYTTTMIEADHKADSPQKIDGDPKDYTYSVYYTFSVLSSEGYR